MRQVNEATYERAVSMVKVGLVTSICIIVTGLLVLLGRGFSKRGAGHE